MKKKTRLQGWLAPHVLSPINAYLVIILSVWAHYDTGAKGAMLPVLFAVLILIMNNGVQFLAKGPTGAVLVLTAIIGYVAWSNLSYYRYRHDDDSVLRAVLMLASSTIAFGSLIYAIIGRSKSMKDRS